MKTTKKKSLLTIALALGMSLAVLSGCSQNDAASTSTASAPAESSAQVASGGTLVLKVNPEIALAYDDAGLVTGLTARNGDAEAILEKSGDLIGQPARDAVRQLVTLIGEAGYFVEEVEGERRQITIEIEPGSALPSDAFLDEVVADVKSTVAEHSWQAPLDIENESDYGIADVKSTVAEHSWQAPLDIENESDYGITDYVDTDYGPENDGVTDYGADTDYGPNNDGVTDYGADTDYGPDNDGVTDYGNDGASNYGDDGATNYGDDGATNYGDSAYGY